VENPFFDEEAALLNVSQAMDEHLVSSAGAIGVLNAAGSYPFSRDKLKVFRSVINKVGYFLII